MTQPIHAIEGGALARMVLDLLERTAMVFADEGSDDADYAVPTRFARIEYSGPTRGTLTLAATDGFLAEVASSLLGVEPEDVDLKRDGDDALQEIANTLGGSVVLALTGEHCEYSLGLPQVVAAPDASETVHAACVVVAEGGPLRVGWCDELASQAA